MSNVQAECNMTTSFVFLLNSERRDYELMLAKIIKRDNARMEDYPCTLPFLLPYPWPWWTIRATPAEEKSWSAITRHSHRVCTFLYLLSRAPVRPPRRLSKPLNKNKPPVRPPLEQQLLEPFVANIFPLLVGNDLFIPRDHYFGVRRTTTRY